jgi:hypothetical protein
MPRATKGVKAPRHDPLYTELDQDEDLKKYGRVSQPGKRSKKKNQRSDDEDEEVGKLFGGWYSNTDWAHFHRSFWTHRLRGRSSSWRMNSRKSSVGQTTMKR